MTESREILLEASDRQLVLADAAPKFEKLRLAAALEFDFEGFDGHVLEIQTQAPFGTFLPRLELGPPPRQRVFGVQAQFTRGRRGR